MELRHIRYFLAVAEEGNFTRAAARVGIGQPPLSQQIKDLEREVGAVLFHRVPHGAELTEAGIAFLKSVRTMPDQAASAMREARRAARGETGALRIGFTGSAVLNPQVPRVIRAFRRRYPDVSLGLVEANSTELSHGLRADSLDLAFMRPAAVDGEGMRITHLFDEPMIAALPSGHSLLTEHRNGAIPLSGLRDDHFIFTPREIGPTLFDAAVEACRSVGFEPRLGQAAPQMGSVLSLVAAEQGFSIVPVSMRQLALEGVRYCNLSDAAPVAPLAIVYPATSRSGVIRNFVDLAVAAAPD